ncbi:MAG: alpha/beta hydrolase [Bacteroidales bacterium]|nr:alpha/beta hydrolase [Bacteroidales bacterium]
MVKKIQFKNIIVNFKDEGEGKVVVLLHGYLETLDVWTDFSKTLAETFRVISIDLLGHGQSGTFNVNTMDLMAEAVEAVITNLNVEKCFVIGHSLGGYVTLAFADNYAHRLFGFSLFHSSAYSDNVEKIKNREREIKLVKQGKKELLFNTNIPLVFANENTEKFSSIIERNKKNAIQTTDRGIVASLKGMVQRPDRTNVLKDTKIPVLYFIGTKDNFIPVPVALKQAELSKKIKAVVLQNSGHIGFVEDKEKSVRELSDFVNECY